MKEEERTSEILPVRLQSPFVLRLSIFAISSLILHPLPRILTRPPAALKFEIPAFLRLLTRLPSMPTSTPGG